MYVLIASQSGPTSLRLLNQHAVSHTFVPGAVSGGNASETFERPTSAIESHCFTSDGGSSPAKPCDLSVTSRA